MNLVPYSLEKQFSDFSNQFQKMFNQWSPVKHEEGFNSNFMVNPSIDVEETENDVLVRAEIPGLNKDEFSIELNKDQLIIKGEKKHESEKNEGNYYRRECSYGSFMRRIQLPTEVDDTKADAEYKNGVLNIRIPKSEEAHRKRINVKVS